MLSVASHRTGCRGEVRYRQEVLERLDPSTVALALEENCSGEAPHEPILL